MVVTGRVQGVGFRAACARQARALGVGGSVHNLVDGRVEAVFEGEQAAVDSLVAWCGHGPSYAHVAQVVVTPEEPIGESGFRAG